MKKLFILFILILTSISFSAKANDFAVNNSNGKTIFYNITSSTYPYTVEVTLIGYNNTTVCGLYDGNLTIPQTVTYNSINYTVTGIGSSAFCNCDSLLSVTIPNSIISIEDRSFPSCLSLTSINVDPLNPNYTSVNGILYSKLLDTLIAYPGGKSGVFTIPNSVTCIGDGAFNEFSSLTSITIPNSVTSIGEEAFKFCVSLTSINLPNSLISIGDEAFGSCDGLTSINLPNSLISIGQGAFGWCDGLTSINLPNSLISIGQSAFEECVSLTSIIIPNSVNYIGRRSFKGCEALTSISASPLNLNYSSIDNVLYSKLIDTLIFCSKAKSGIFNIPTSVNYLYDYAFEYCSNLTSIIIPNSVTSIETRVFQWCIGLTSIIIPNSVTSIGNSAFNGCSSLSSLTIGNSVTALYANCFWGCIGLTSITSLAITAPTISQMIFPYEFELSRNIPIYVICGSASQYQSAPYWNSFTNFQDNIPIPTTNLESTICQGEIYNINGFNEDSTGTYIHNIQTLNGCDSIVALNLVVNPTPIMPTNLAVQLMPNYLEITWQSNGTSYEIYRDGDSIATVTQPIYMDNSVVNGQAYCYKVKAIIGDCKSEFCNVVCRSFVGLNNLENQELSIQLYPNPTKDRTILEINGLKDQADVILYDLFGKTIKNYKLNADQGKLEIDVSDVAKGIYNIKVVNNDYSITRKLIVR